MENFFCNVSEKPQKTPWLYLGKRQMRQTLTSFYKGRLEARFEHQQHVCRDNGKDRLVLWLKEEQMVCGSRRRTFPSSVEAARCWGWEAAVTEGLPESEAQPGCKTGRLVGRPALSSVLRATAYSLGLTCNMRCINSKCKTVYHSIVCEIKNTGNYQSVQWLTNG